LHVSPLQAQVASLVAATGAQDPAYARARAASFDPRHPLHGAVASAYAAWLGFYNSNLRKLGWQPAELVQRANHLATCWGFPALPPPLQRKTVGKMGLKGVPGLNIE
jgi:ATP-dependent RNA helicase MSS116